MAASVAVVAAVVVAVAPAADGTRVPAKVLLLAVAVVEAREKGRRPAARRILRIYSTPSLAARRSFNSCFAFRALAVVAAVVVAAASAVVDSRPS